MTNVQGNASNAAQNLDVLAQAAQAYHGGDRPNAAAVAQALLQAEKATRQQKVQIPLAALSGEWRLCYTTGVRKLRRGGIALGRGFYVPKFAPARIGFCPEGDRSGSIRNQVSVGGLTLRFTGPINYLDHKNLLAFDFTQVQISLGDRPLYNRPLSTGKFGRGSSREAIPFEQRTIAQLPFFAFFQATPDWIAARGRGGGLALWIREESQG